MRGHAGSPPGPRRRRAPQGTSRPRNRPKALSHPTPTSFPGSPGAVGCTVLPAPALSRSSQSRRPRAPRCPPRPGGLWKTLCASVRVCMHVCMCECMYVCVRESARECVRVLRARPGLLSISWAGPGQPGGEPGVFGISERNCEAPTEHHAFLPTPFGQRETRGAPPIASHARGALGRARGAWRKTPCSQPVSQRLSPCHEGKLAIGETETDQNTPLGRADESGVRHLPHLPHLGALHCGIAEWPRLRVPSRRLSPRRAPKSTHTPGYVPPPPGSPPICPLEARTTPRPRCICSRRPRHSQTVSPRPRPSRLRLRPGCARSTSPLLRLPLASSAPPSPLSSSGALLPSRPAASAPPTPPPLSLYASNMATRLEASICFPGQGDEPANPGAWAGVRARWQFRARG